MAAEYLTPKPIAEELMPVCPPPPELPHRTLALTPTSRISPTFDNDDDDEALLELSIGNFLSGIVRNTSSPTSPPPSRRSYEGIGPTPVSWLKPRFSKYTPPIAPIDTCPREPMKRIASSQQLILLSRNKKSKMTRTTSFCRAA